MGITEKAKELADAALRKAGELSETAREKAPDFLDKAADVTAKAVDSAAAGIDRATGGKYHDKIEDATAKVEGTLDRVRTPETAATTAEPVEDPVPPAPATPLSEPPATGADAPITPASTNLDATDPDTSKP